MMKRTIVYCTQCQSEDVSISLTNEPKPERVSMDEYAQNEGEKSDFPLVKILPSVNVYRINKYLATCNSCKYSVRWEKQGH